MAISIDYGSSMVNIVEGDPKKNGVSVRKAVTIATPPLSVRDGEIIDMGGAAAAIRSVIVQNKFVSKQITFTLNSTQMLHRELIVPRGDIKRLAPVVKNEMLQYIGTGEEFAVDFLFSDEPVVENPSMIKVYAYAVPKRMALSYVNLTRALGLKPRSLQMHQSSMSKLVKLSNINGTRLSDKSFIVCDVGSSTMNIYLFSCDKMIFSRCIKTSYDNFMTSMLTLSKFNTPEDVYKTLDVSPTSLKEDMPEAQASAMFVSTLSEEIQRMVQFSLSRKLEVPVSSVYLCGGVSSLCGITDNLCAALELPVCTIDTLPEVSAPQDIYLGEYINAIAALANS